jgi:hypothetical protein
MKNQKPHDAALHLAKPVSVNYQRLTIKEIKMQEKTFYCH